MNTKKRLDHWTQTVAYYSQRLDGNLYRLQGTIQIQISDTSMTTKRPRGSECNAILGGQLHCDCCTGSDGTWMKNKTRVYYVFDIIPLSLNKNPTIKITIKLHCHK